DQTDCSGSSYRPPRSGLSPAFGEPLLATIVPQKSHGSQGFFMDIQTLAQLRGMLCFAAATWPLADPGAAI
ncbi:MAG TPA: hypothetical protein VNN98_09375, partial [Rhizomicrobium sp.]|nr:hypothetical protein [Rhizomicrobium sp.]